MNFEDWSEERKELEGKLLVELNKWSIADICSILDRLSSRRFTDGETDAYEAILKEELGHRTWEVKNLAQIVQFQRLREEEPERFAKMYGRK